MRKTLISFIAITILFSLASFVFAQQGRELEIEYPGISGAETPKETTTLVPEYVKYIYNFLIAISGIIALGVLIYAGIQYYTSAGNIEKISDAKSRITAAVLGLVILFGSYLILYSINPDLVSIKLERLRPIISELSPGVLACRGVVGVKEVWELTIEFKYKKPSEDREREIKKRLDLILENISKKCYYIPGEGNIPSHLDNKIVVIYFIPSIEYASDGSIINHTSYGAVAYQERSFEGKSEVLYQHMFAFPITGPEPKEEPVLALNVSSIKPFVVNYYKPDPNWEVILYKYYDFNKEIGFLEGEKFFLNKPPCKALYCETNLAYLKWSPKSIKIEGDLFVVLFDKDSKSETFFSESDSNLEDNDNIVEWVDCALYKSGTTKKCEKKVGTIYSQQTIIINCCAKAAATRMIIISAKPY